MAFEASHLQRATSPASSGRASPVYPRSRGRADDGPNRKDKNFRRYASGVERALSLFDTALQEWADYISFLGRLLKALQVRPNGSSDIPHKVLVSKRLAQCLNPALPSGVHQKTLEVYGYIFSILTKDGLGRDLPLYLPGLSPTLSFASSSVKPALLSLFETFILPLDPGTLRPALKAIVLSLLPGLEEESGEEFERTFGILNGLKDVSGLKTGETPNTVDVSRDQFFWQCLFLASITNSNRRQGALSFLARKLPKLGPPSDLTPFYFQRNKKGGIVFKAEHLSPAMEAVTSPEPGLLVRCFATGLRDEQLLIQRGFLDLLVTHLPLHSPVLLVKVTPMDLEKLIAAAASVVARREMSLNRRLWTWFLGPETLVQRRDSAHDLSDSEENNNLEAPSSFTQSEYFERYGLDSLVSSIQKMLANESLVPASKARPFRICLSLMDRWEIGGLVVPKIFLTAMESVWQYQKATLSKESFTEVLRSANVFFDGVESGLIWGELTKLLKDALQGGEPGLQHAQDRLDLVLFIITKFNIKDEEMINLHIPLTALFIQICIRNNQLRSSIWSNVNHIGIFRRALTIFSHLVDLIPERAFAVASSQGCPNGWKAKEGGSDPPNRQLMDAIMKFYTHHQGSLEGSAQPISAREIGELLIDSASQMIEHDLNPMGLMGNLEIQLSILEKLIRKIPYSEKQSWESFLSVLVDYSKLLSTKAEEHFIFQAISVITTALEIVQLAMPIVSWKSDYRVRQIIPNLINSLWFQLSPSRPQFNVEAARCILRIQRISPESQLIEGSITAMMVAGRSGSRVRGTDVEAARRFITLWAHSVTTLTGPLSSPRIGSTTNQNGDQAFKERFILARPLLLLLDSLFSPKTELFFFVSNWLGSLPSLQIIFDFLLQRLQGLGLLNKPDHADDLNATFDNADEILYFLQTISNLVQFSKENIWSALTAKISVDSSNSGESKVKKSPTEEAEKTATDEEPVLTVQTRLTRICLHIFRIHKQEDVVLNDQSFSLCRAAAILLQHLFLGPSSAFIAEDNFEIFIIETLSWSVKYHDVLLQIHLMDLVLVALRSRLTDSRATSIPTHRRTMSRETIRPIGQAPLSAEKNDKDQKIQTLQPPLVLLDCMMLGLRSPSTHPVLEHWVVFLNDCLSLYPDNGTHILMPLVDCFIKSLEVVFKDMRSSFEESQPRHAAAVEPTTTLITLLNGLEQALASAHQQLLHSDAGVPSAKSPEQVQGFFGNMVSGVFSPEIQKSRPMTANNRLTVLLCFKDAVRLGLKIWSWGDHRIESLTTLASFNHTSVRMKNRTRRILEHLFAAEALECLETLIEAWSKQDMEVGLAQGSTVFNLLHALNESRPRNTIPAIFNAIYSRTNPNALDPVRKSTLTSELSDLTLAGFLIAYMRSLEDDAMDEIWTDCMTFLRDVLANPLPHRQTLPKLLEFTAILGQKVDNTNFGEQRRMRRDLGDLFVRLLSATFTTRPLGFSLDISPALSAEKSSSDSLHNFDLRKTSISDDIVAILASIVPNLSKILIDPDRITAAATTVSTQVLSPTFRWKSYPQNVTESTLGILYAMSRIPEASKIWRRDVAEAFNDSKFFCASSLALAEKGWLPILRQWVLLDKDRMPELLARLSAPTSAGIMFGVGASSARLEADRKTQFNLRRIATLVLASDHDTFAVNLSSIQEKLVELMTATAASSPSSATRSEIFMLLRSLLLKTSPVHLVTLWPIITSELYDAISSLFPDGSSPDTYNINCVVQGSKLLELLIVLAPDDFQLREWLFITDTIDAVYRPRDWDPVALVDELAEDLDSRAGLLSASSQQALNSNSNNTNSEIKRKPLLISGLLKGVAREELLDRVLRPFFRGLSINSFESVYNMEAPEWQACYEDLLADVFDEGTIV